MKEATPAPSAREETQTSPTLLAVVDKARVAAAATADDAAVAVEVANAALGDRPDATTFVATRRRSREAAEVDMVLILLMLLMLMWSCAM